MTWWSERVVPRVTDAALRSPTLGRSRARAATGLSGRVLELGFGGGLNLPHLPAAVTALGAVDPSDAGWRMSARRRAASRVDVERVDLAGTTIDADDASYDAALCTFTLCTIPDVTSALAEVRRVVRAGGRLHFLEHGLSPAPAVAAWQYRLDPWQRRLVGGCRLVRDPAALLVAAGLDVVRLETGALPGFRGPAPHTYGYLGVATL